MDKLSMSIQILVFVSLAIIGMVLPVLPAQMVKFGYLLLFNAPVLKTQIGIDIVVSHVPQVKFGLGRLMLVLVQPI